MCAENDLINAEERISDAREKIDIMNAISQALLNNEPLTDEQLTWLEENNLGGLYGG